MRILAFFLCLGMLAGGILLLVDYSKTSPEVTYSGDVTFTSEEEYTSFKKYLMQPEVKIKEVQILASEPPIWVRYRIEAPRSWEFPFSFDYKDAVTTLGRALGYAFMVTFGFLGGVFSGTWTFGRPRE